MSDLKETTFVDTNFHQNDTYLGADSFSYRRGAVKIADGRLCIGRIGAPPQQEATSEQFYFWIPPDVLVEKTQLVTCNSQIGEQEIRFYAIVDEVYRRSRKRNMDGEVDEHDSDLTYESAFDSDGITYASASILRAEPPVLTPPRERSNVLLGGEDEAVTAYGYEEMARPMTVGRLRNGGSNYAGLAKIDLAYLLGDNGGHLNVTGMAGVGTKSSFLLTIVKLLFYEAQPQFGREPLYVVPIVFNVKGEDLMWIDQPNRDFKEKHEEDWDALGIQPTPFKEAEFYAPTEPGSAGAPTIDGCNAKTYSWSLSDVLAGELFSYLFSGDDTSPMMMALVYEIVAFFTKPDGKQLRPEAPAQTWKELLTWIREQAAMKDGARDVKMHQTGTWRAVYRRLWDILAEGESIFPKEAHSGQPLKVTRDKTSPPQVIDIHDLSASLKRFVVAAVVKQVVAARTGRHAIRGLRYILVLDELNRFAPRNNTDSITRLLESVASEMRSQGIILLGAQQLASQVSTKILENTAIRVLGRTGPAELQDKVWQAWDNSARRQASVLRPEEKLIIQPTFRQPMFIKVPFPAWAMRREDIAPLPLSQTPEV